MLTYDERSALQKIKILTIKSNNNGWALRPNSVPPGVLDSLVAKCLVMRGERTRDRRNERGRRYVRGSFSLLPAAVRQQKRPESQAAEKRSEGRQSGPHSRHRSA